MPDPNVTPQGTPYAPTQGMPGYGDWVQAIPGSGGSWTPPGGLQPHTHVAGDIVPSPGALPVGGMLMFGGSTAPDGWLLCDGSAVSRRTFSALFAVLGTTYGAGDGSTTFNVPDMRGRIPVGVGTGTGGGASGTGLPTGGSALTTVARGTWKGEETHVLSTAELAGHTHDMANHTHFTVTGGPSNNTTTGPSNNTTGGITANHHHNWGGFGGNTFVEDSGGDQAGTNRWRAAVGSGGGPTFQTDGVSNDHGHSMQNHTHDMQNHTHSGTSGGPSSNLTGNTGSGTPHNNIQPVMGLNFIIRAF